jgi:hypothetical protein
MHVLRSLLALSSICAIQADDSPIRKVVKLVTSMKATAEKEAESDKEAYDKFVCWADTNEVKKEKTIEDEKANVQIQEAFVETSSGTSASLSAEIKDLKSDIADAKEALAEAEELRVKESDNFQAEEADMKETIGLLKEALTALSFLQKQRSNVAKVDQAAALLQVRQVVTHIAHNPRYKAMQRDLYDMLGSLETVTAKQVNHRGSSLRGESALVQDFLKGDDDPVDESGLSGAAAGAKSYNKQSGPVVGILKEMQDEFERDLAKAQKEDFAALVTFQTLKATKTAEMTTAAKQKSLKESEVAELDAEIAEAKESITASNATITPAQKYLTNLVKRRTSEDEEYAERDKTRTEEITALGEVTTVLTDEDARILFAKTISFIQVGVSSSTRGRRQNHASKRAMQLLMRAGRKHKNMALIGMAVRAGLDKFTAVKKSLDEMAATLKLEQATEYSTWEECKTDIDKQEDEITEAKETKEDLAEKRQEVVNNLATLKTGKAESEDELADLQAALKEAEEQRETQTALYNTSITDQQATNKILKVALTKLEGFYTLVQTKQSPDDPDQVFRDQPATKKYTKNAGASGVMQLMMKIIGDAEKVEQELILTEAKAEKDYKQLVEDTRVSVDAVEAAIDEKEKQSAAQQSEKSETDVDITANGDEIEKMEELLKGIHTGCDWLLNNFDLRQKARSEEMDSINDAKAILSGA